MDNLERAKRNIQLPERIGYVQGSSQAVAYATAMSIIDCAESLRWIKDFLIGFSEEVQKVNDES